jgi:beta-1,4-mannooligosaccharide/beta-1,4-mannosyl-N-acetylglucosamine phosphorylase
MLDLSKRKAKNSLTILNQSIPWQNRSANDDNIIWRYQKNPIVSRYAIPSANSIFNSAVIPFEDGFAGVFRCDDKSIRMNLHVGFSKDGIQWDIENQPIEMIAGNTQLVHSDYRYDPRITFIDGKYWLTWCNGYYGPTIGIAYTLDFETFYQCENAFLPFNRNGVLFPEKIDGKYAILSRPSDNGHTPFGDIFLSFSPDMKYWGEHRMVMQITPFEESAWQCTKIGAGPVPIKTDEGWLIIYHGVIQTCNGFRYAMGAALTDLNNPEKVLYRGKNYLLGPAEPYELMGDVPNVIFPVAALAEENKIAIYYGAADTSVCLCFGYISEIIAYIKEHPI